jgi:hypothetical protein
MAWRLISNSVIGSSHKSSGKPNQDRLSFYPSSNYPENFPIIFTIADGHGGKKYFRSERGATFAVETAIEICKQQLENTSWDSIKDKKFKEWICRDIFRKWLEKVHADIQENPFSDEEKELLMPKSTATTKVPYIVNDNYNVFAYGSTLLTVIIHESYLLFLQLGDGDILVVKDDGTIDKPIPDDDRLIGNETTSLCLPEAWSEFKYKLSEISPDSQFPDLILISTDGYKNSFSEESGFEKVGSDLLSMICENPDGIFAGLDSIEDNLADWLNSASEKGSGDDTTVGIIFNLDQIKKYRDENYEISIRKKKSSLPESDNQPSENRVEPIQLDSNEIIPDIFDGKSDEKMIEENSSIDQL